MDKLAHTLDNAARAGRYLAQSLLCFMLGHAIGVFWRRSIIGSERTSFLRRLSIHLHGAEEH